MKNSFSNKIAAALSALGIVGFSMAAQAVLAPVNGAITFYGGAVLDGPIGSATSFVSYTGPAGSSKPVVGGVDGDYASVPLGTAATFGAFSFDQPLGAPFVLWQFILGSQVYNFTATSATVVQQDSHFLNIMGTGVAYIDGFAQTPGTWTITDTGSTPVLSFGSGTVAVPEPSAQTLLLVFAPVAWFVVVRAKSGRNRQVAL